jgi:hypothetical protein
VREMLTTALALMGMLYLTVKMVLSIFVWLQALSPSGASILGLTV